MVNTIYHYVILSYSHSIRVLRTHGFLIMLGIVILLGYFLVPPEHAGYQTMYVGEMRSIYNSAWLGAVATLSISLFLWPFGFFLLRNKISEDRQSSMGSIIFASQASKVRYLFSKMMGHFLTLAVMAGVLELAFIAMQYVRGEESQLVVSDYLFPYLWIALPSLFVLAALIILFDAISIFRGIIGIILFFSLWTALSAISFSGLGTLDVFGAHFIFTEVSQDIKAMFPHVGSIHMNFGYQTAQNLTIFKWEGVTWTIENILSRLLWLLLGAFLFLISVLAFRRTTLLSMQDSTTTPQTGSEFIREDREENRKLHLRPIEKAGHYSFSSIFRSEWRLMIKEVPVWWLGIGSVLFLLTVVVPFSYTKIFLTLPWLWVIPYLASAGARERMYPLFYLTVPLLGSYLPFGYLVSVSLF